MLKNKDSKQRANFSKNSEVAYFLWLKSGCPESIEEIAYFSMLQSGRPRGADRAIWNETKRRLESHIRDNMGLPQPEAKVKKVSVNSVKNIDSKVENKVESKADLKKVVVVKKSAKNVSDKSLKVVSKDIKTPKSALNRMLTSDKTDKTVAKQKINGQNAKHVDLSVHDKNVISLKHAVKSKTEVKVKKTSKKVSALTGKKNGSLDKKVVKMPVVSKIVKDKVDTKVVNK